MGFFKVEAISAEEAQKNLEENSPGLLVIGETLDMAFKEGRDEHYFTSQRILVVNKLGITGKRVEYKSIPYSSIKAFSVETSGLLDLESNLMVHTGSVDFELKFDTKKVNLYTVQKYLSHHVFADSFPGFLFNNVPLYQLTREESVEENTNKPVNYVRQDSVRYEKGVVVNDLRNNGTLLPDEDVKLTFKSGCDMIICTSIRILYIKMQKGVEYLSIRNSCIKAYKVEASWSFPNSDATVNIFTDISTEKRFVKLDIRKADCRMVDILKYLNSLFSEIEEPLKEDAIPEAFDYSQHPKSIKSLQSHDVSQSDSILADQEFHTLLPILQFNEICEMAFKGRIDLVLFTSKRILFIRNGHRSGQEITFTSLPYSSIKVFQVTTSNALTENEFELGFFTEIPFEPPKCDGCEHGCSKEHPTPGMAYLELEINANTTDVLGLFKYISLKLEQYNRTSNPDIEETAIVKPSPPGSINKFLSYFGKDLTPINRQSLKQSETALIMEGEIPVLLKDEKVFLGFNCEQDSTIFTSKRILEIDLQGFRGTCVEFRCIPYNTIRYFATVSNNLFDTKCELNLSLCTPWLPSITRKFGSEKVDILAIQNVIAAKTLHDDPEIARETYEDDFRTTINPSGTLDNMIAFVDARVQFDPKEIEQRFKKEIPILQGSEEVEFAFKYGINMYLYTTKRLLSMDLEQFKSNKIEFASLPFKYIQGFSVRSAKGLRRTVTLTLFSSGIDEAGKRKFGKRDTDILEISNILASKIMRTKQ